MRTREGMAIAEPNGKVCGQQPQLTAADRGLDLSAHAASPAGLVDADAEQKDEAERSHDGDLSAFQMNRITSRSSLRAAARLPRTPTPTLGGEVSLCPRLVSLVDARGSVPARRA